MPHTSYKQKNNRDDYLSPLDVGIDNLPVIEISDQMYRLAETIAEARAITYQSIDGGDVHGSQSSLDAHLTGVLGELAVQLICDDEEQAIYIRGDPGYDVVHDGATVDVKSSATHLNIPDLLIPYDQELIADIYLQTHRINPREIRLIGWATREYIKGLEPERHPGHQWNRVVRPEEMRAPPELHG